jgi:NCAIR mutase (PurE)-related protein
MNADALCRLLEDVQAGRLSVTAALSELRWLPFAELGFAKADTHRVLRRGAAEAVFCPGKSPEQIVEIAARLREAGSVVLLTRATPEVAGRAAQVFSDARYVPAARLVMIGHPPEPRTGLVAVLTGGTGDAPVAEEAACTAEAMGAAVERAYDVGVSGLHRLGAQRDLLDRAFAIVVASGMDGALPAVVAGVTRVPVIGVPTSVGYGVHLGGIAPLLTMLNACAPGVAVVNIDNGFGAGYLAAQINHAASRKGDGPRG